MKKEMQGKQLALIGGLFVVLFLIVLFTVILPGGGDDPAPTTAPPPSPVTTPIEAPTEDEDDEEQAKPGKPPVETTEVFARRDPFEPVVDTAPAAPDGAAAPAPAPAPETEGGEDDTDGAEREPTGRRIRLIDVFERRRIPRAQIEVDGTVFTVREGEAFAASFQLLTVSGDCVSLLFGDDQFSLCEGEEIIK